MMGKASAGHGAGLDFGSEAWNRLEPILELFERALSRGERPALEAFVPALQPAPRRALLAELVHADLEFRLKAAEPARVEDYLTRYPELGSDPDVLLGLIRAEYQVRRQREPALGRAEYEARFPGHGAALATDPAETPGREARAGEGRPARVVAAPETLEAVAGPPPALARLGDFRILREVGRGGMGVVYEAEQVSLGRHVALKVLPQKWLGDAQTRTRFAREAKAAARLHHTNIVPVFGVGEQDGMPYYVMQFIRGLGLDQVLEELKRLQPGGHVANGPWARRHVGDVPRTDVSPADTARSLLTGQFVPGAENAPAATATAPTSAAGNVLDPFSLPSSSVALPGTAPGSAPKALTYWQSLARIGFQVADALAYAHKQGVLHRDIKPSNLLLDSGGTVWITDFGLAKADDQPNLTHTGDLLGTLRYLPPEAFEGKADARGDVYALGLTLYELLCLRPAFDERERNRLIKQVTAAEPARLDRRNRAVPRDLVTIVHKAIARDPAHRYQTPAEMAEDLKRFVEDRPVRARRVSGAEKLWRWCRRNPLPAGLVAGIVLVFLAGFAGVFWQWRVAAMQQKEAEKQTEIALTREQEALQQAEKAKKARAFLVSIFQISERDTQGGNLTARQILADAERRIPVEFADQPELRAELAAAVAGVKRGIGRQTPQAMILEVRGTVQLQSFTGVKKAAVPQALVNLDDRLSLSAHGQVQLVFLSDFHKERLKPGREVTIDYKGCEPADAILERDDSVLMTFVRLPKGTFYMGWNGYKKGVKTEIKEDFEIAVHEVTQGQWQALMGNNPSWFSRKGNGRNVVVDISDEELKLFPVEMVSWNDVQEFIRKLNEKERGRGYLYRLPTEAEWEYACRGGATSEEECSYHFYFDKPTNDLSSEQANFNGNLPSGKAPKRKYLGRPTHVGAYPPNKLGLCDMNGNVWQWCADAYGVGPARVMRGGCWQADAMVCRAASRHGALPTDTRSSGGFRLARVPVR
jgi:formylglycine-generating enzyme required for sulfatase activity/serine/threonine protein kinase